MFVICIKKLALKIMKENEMTLLPTQYYFEWAWDYSK